MTAERRVVRLVVLALFLGVWVMLLVVFWGERREPHLTQRGTPWVYWKWSGGQGELEPVGLAKQVLLTAGVTLTLAAGLLLFLFAQRNVLAARFLEWAVYCGSLAAALLLCWGGGNSAESYTVKYGGYLPYVSSRDGLWEERGFPWTYWKRKGDSDAGEFLPDGLVKLSLLSAGMMASWVAGILSYRKRLRKYEAKVREDEEFISPPEAT